MGKFKSALCPGCNKKVERHNPSRITITMPRQFEEPTHVTWHLECWQQQALVDQALAQRQAIEEARLKTIVTGETDFSIPRLLRR